MGTRQQKDGLFDTLFANEMQVETATVIEEQSSAPVDPTGTTQGSLWVKDDNPNSLVFTDNLGTDWTLSGAGSSETWATTLAAGNTSSGTGVIISSGDDITAPGALPVSATGRLTLSSALASSDSILIDATDSDGGIDINSGRNGLTFDTTGFFSLDCTSTSDACNITHAGAAGLDLTISCTAGSLNLTGGEADTGAVAVSAPAGGVSVTGGLASSDAIVLSAPSGSMKATAGIAGLACDLDFPSGSFDMTCGIASSDSCKIECPSGGVELVASLGMDVTCASGGFSGTFGGNDVEFTIPSNSFSVTAGESTSDSISFTASGGASGITLSSGTAGINILPKSTVSQATDINTEITSTGNSGVLTTQSASTAAGGNDSFRVVNTHCDGSSIVHVTVQEYSGTLTTNGLPVAIVSGVSDGAFDITIVNAHSANALSGTLDIGYNIF